MAASYIPPAGVTLEVRAFCQLENQGSVNVRHYRVSSVAGGGTDLKTMIDGISASMAANYKALMYNFAVYRGAGIRQVFPLPASSEVFSVSGAGAASVIGPPLAAQTCGLISLRTNVGGRKGRGRIYIPFPSTADATDQFQPAPAYMTRLTTYATLLLNTLTIGTAPATSTLVPVLWNRAARTVIDLTFFMTPRKWATQRRRGAFGRPNESPV